MESQTGVVETGCQRSRRNQGATCVHQSTDLWLSETVLQLKYVLEVLMDLLRQTRMDNISEIRDRRDKKCWSLVMGRIITFLQPAGHYTRIRPSWDTCGLRKLWQTARSVKQGAAILGPLGPGRGRGQRYQPYGRGPGGPYRGGCPHFFWGTCEKIMINF